MKKCPICGNLIGMFDNSTVITFNNKKFELCNTCSENRRNLHNDNENVVKSSKEYFLKYKVKEYAEPEIRSVLNQYIQIADKKIGNDIEELPTCITDEDIAKIIITSGCNFEGHKIIEYKSILSASAVKGTGILSEVSASFSDFLGQESDDFSDKIEKTKNIVLAKIKRQAVLHEVNAIIGIKYDIFSIAANMIAVSISGTGVNIE